MENWRRFVEEVEGEEQVEDGGELSKQLLALSVPDFVNRLNQNNREDMEALLMGLKDGSMDDDKIKIVPANVPVVQLKPTQNEVVWDKSIPFALERPKVFMEYYSSDGPFEVGPPGNDAIITLNGEYIMDGHHRWSSLYCVNPRASIATFDIQIKSVGPLEMLRLIQASILSAKQEIPSAKGGGTNLFGIPQEEIKGEVLKILTPELANQYVALGFLEGDGGDGGTDAAAEDGRSQKRTQAVAKKLIGIYKRNIKIMQSASKPVSGANKRDSMPQTDKVGDVAAGGAIPAGLAPLTKGVIDHEPPFKK